MCCDESHPSLGSVTRTKGIPKIVDLNNLMPYARFLCGEEEVRRTAAGFVGYGMTRTGDRVLFAVDTHYEPLVVEAMMRAEGNYSGYANNPAASIYGAKS